MRPVDPDWKALKARYGDWIVDGILKYRADEIRRYEALRDELADDPTPRELEVGSNRGRFIKALCKGRPDVQFYGVEIKESLVDTARRRLARHELDNGRILHGDVRVMLPVAFAPDALNAIHVLFPDPWWKERHAKRRLMKREFVGLARRTLTPGGHLVVVTDVPTYARWARENIESVGGFERVSRDDVPGSETWAPTTRERHCMEDGIPIRRMYYRLTE